MPRRAVAIEHLEQLRKAVTRAGLSSTCHYAECSPRLEVHNPQITNKGPGRPGPMLRESITVGTGRNGMVFHWSTGEPLGPVDDIPAADARLRQVLAADSAAPLPASMTP